MLSDVFRSITSVDGRGGWRRAAGMAEGWLLRGLPGAYMAFWLLATN
jgi:hypothetical protein